MKQAGSVYRGGMPGRTCVCASVRMLLVVAFIVSGFSTRRLAAQIPEVSRGPAMDWVDWVDPDISPATAREDGLSGGVFTLLLDRQVDVETSAYFQHEVLRILNPAGLAQLSRMEVSFDPGYQTFTLHRLRILRGREVVDLTDTQLLRTREREVSLEWNLYNGQLSVEALLENTRVGDVVEWAYTIQGSNPVFADKTTVNLGLSSTEYIRRYRVRILLPADNPDRFFLHACPWTPDDMVRRAGREIIAEAEPLNPSDIFPDAPAWYHPYALITVREYADWSEVVHWALPMYTPPVVLPAELDEIREVLTGQPTEEAKILTALRYAQDTLRYVSVASGLHSHKPYPLADVLQRRFGDCKDKAMLLTSLLLDQGILAWPALVNTWRAHTLPQQAPSPLAFDHVIVGVQTGDGALHWIDPTLNHQRGNLQTIFMPRYGKALLLREGESALREMPGNGRAVSHVEVVETYLFAESPDEGLRLIVTNTFSGWEADYIRSVLAAQSLQSLQDRYLDHYTKMHGSATALAPLQVVDHEEQNRIQILESWHLPSPWWPSNGDEVPKIRLEPAFADLMNHSPQSLRLQRPFALIWPKAFRHIISLHLPFPLPFDAEQFSRDSPEISFSMADGIQGDIIRIEYQFATHNDHVPAERLVEHKRLMDEIQVFSAYQLAHPWKYMEQAGLLDNGEDVVFVANNTLLLVLAVCLWVFIAVNAWKWGNRPCRPCPDRSRLLGLYPDLNGIGGWLVLPIIGIGVNLLNLARSLLVTESLYLFDQTVWNNLTNSESVLYHALWLPQIVLEVVMPVFFSAFLPVLLICLFRRRAAVRAMFLFYFLTNMVFAGLNALFSFGLGEHVDEGVRGDAIRQVLQACVGATIWVPYFLRSVRVKVAFYR
jgi:hypothetical protein